MTIDEASQLTLGQHVQLVDGRVCSVEAQDAAGGQIQFRFADDTIGYIRWMNLPTATAVASTVSITPQYLPPITPIAPLPNPIP